MKKTIHRFRSNYEKVVCGKLDDQNVSFEYETVNLHYVVSEQRKYTPDVILPNGIILELKGRFTTNKLFKGSKTTYSKWCDKNNIKWADNLIPIEWINEKKK